MQEPRIVKPWYKQFWPWVIIGLPTSVVIASIVTYFIALDGIDSVVSKDYYKEAARLGNEEAETKLSGEENRQQQ